MTAISRRLERAARNNALWCDTVCRAHDSPGEFQEAIWVNRLGTPRYYPDAVTLMDAAASHQFKIISALLEAGRTGEWSVKDSFQRLDLSPLGFQPLFDAQWIEFDPDPLQPPTIPFGYTCAAIRSAAELVAWEMAWGGNEDVTAAPDEPMFPPALLSERQVDFLAIKFDDRIVGGGVLNQGGGVVGMSNVFSLSIEPQIIWRALTAYGLTAFPGQSFVGYESGASLSVATRAGFSRLGPLRVWTTGLAR